MRINICLFSIIGNCYAKFNVMLENYWCGSCLTNHEIASLVQRRTMLQIIDVLLCFFYNID